MPDLPVWPKEVHFMQKADRYHCFTPTVKCEQFKWKYFKIIDIKVMKVSKKNGRKSIFDSIDVEIQYINNPG